MSESNIGPRYKLTWCPTAVPEPAPGEVLIDVRAAALNYRDVLTAMGLIPPRLGVESAAEQATVLGVECAGTVVSTGPGVAHLAAGDRVMAPAARSLSSHAVARADRAMRIPADMTFAEAATLPVPFFTVLHSLEHIARLQPGETLLVHGAAGGVGLAALQYARRIGAEVIATAGSVGKRDLLQTLGVEHVLDSRNLRFAEEIMDLTDGEGVDVVLNSLAGDALIRSLHLLKPHGRFIELGKRDFLADNPMPMAALAGNKAFFGVDISPMVVEDSPLMDRYRSELEQAVHDGTYRPLLHRAYAATHVQDAFACMQYSRHIGKVVVTFDDPVPVAAPAPKSPLRPDASYLITGGLSGLGAATARHLAARGARHMTLVSRRGPHTPEAADLLDDLRAHGVIATAVAADACDPAVMKEVIETLEAQGPLLTGVIHAAMVLDDAPLTELTDARSRDVLAPKVTAGYVLDPLTRERDLDFFIVYSSAAAAIGNAQQSAYVAGNMTLNALVADRRQAGLSALSIQWGPVNDAGYVQRTGIAHHLTTLGLGCITTRDAMRALDQLMADPTAETVTVANCDWGLLADYLPTLAAPRTADLISRQGRTTQKEEPRRALTGLSPEEAHGVIQHDLTELLAKVMQTVPERIDPTCRLDLLGVDSLMATELTGLIRRRFDCEVPSIELASAPSLTAITRLILNRLTSPTP
ncbi:SDR family NAD(P)-dependent oxidoreductase [Streptomyces syringium]|uniref:SDR family NAD(P)-dependent oxidoreductase n=1 Tax=Streptomyces syringium TaxID=76729 RepID=UPI003455F15B